jgi:hypothetical protein
MRWGSGAHRAFAISLLLICSISAGAVADVPEAVRATVDEAFFHVTVTGTLKGESQSHDRHGKAFGIGRNLLVTSRHVVGDPEEWEPDGDSQSDEIARAMRPLQRKVWIQRKADSEAGDENFVLPAPSHAIDAAGISVPDLDLGSYFQLSMCEIEEGQIYTAIMVETDPREPSSIARPTGVELRASGYDPLKYGALYVFDTAPGNASFEGEPDGHDGSPILDREGNVIAIISAVTALGGGRGHRILATPIQPLFPGASTLLSLAPELTELKSSLKCSLADTVRRIHDEVSSHAIWSVDVKRDNEGKASTVHLSYESISQEPNISAIDVYYEFWGIDTNFKTDVTRISFQDPNPTSTIRLDDTAPRKQREFEAHEIARIGRDIVEKHLASIAQNGFIDHVQLYIFQVEDGVRQEKPLVFRTFKWKQ